jgi:5'-nucleotidase (lipoprotein e(P4) family)
MCGMTSRRLVLLSLLLCAGCASTGTAPPPAQGRTGPGSAAPAAVAALVMPESIRWVRDSAEYQAALYQVYGQLAVLVEREAARRSPGTWAVVLDADETVLDNVTYQIERASQGLGFTRESWTAWVRRREATPLPAAGAFLDRVRALGGRIAIVTNRRESECDDTIAVFEAHGLVYDAMLCRPDAGPSDKNPRFAAVAEGRTPASSAPIDVVAFVGDNIHDFPALDQAMRDGGPPAFAEFGVRFFLVPNPMYGSWQ